MLGVLENESTLDSLSGRNLFFVIAKSSLLKISVVISLLESC